MVDASIYENLPDEPEIAFVILEEDYREECDHKERNAERDDRTDVFWAQYITSVQSTLDESQLHDTGISDQSYDFRTLSYESFIDFRQTVLAYASRMKLRFGRKAKEFSVALDPNAKSKLRQLSTKVKEVVDRLDVTAEKREALYARIAALEAEINRNRTRFEVIGSFWLETCGKVGEGIEKLEPLRKWIDPIGGLIGQAKKAERDKPASLFGASLQQKRIIDQRSFGDNIDDDIPF